MSAQTYPESTPAANDCLAADIAAETRKRYCTLRARIPTAGVRTTVLHIGIERTGVLAGCDVEPEAVLVLEIGSGKTARDHFRHVPPTPVELENAIVTVEDEIARARARTRKRSTLLTTDTAIREIALVAGIRNGAEMTLTLDAVEQTFERLVALTLGRRAISEGIPASGEFAATLMILREFMHHLQFSSISVKP